MGPQTGTNLQFLCPESDTSLHWKTMNTGLVYHVACLFTPQLLLALIAPTHEGMDRLS